MNWLKQVFIFLILVFGVAIIFAAALWLGFIAHNWMVS